MTTIDVPGARLYYETRGSGPVLMVIGSPMDSTGFTFLADAMADEYTVVTYDPRGIGNSTRDNATEHITPEMQAEDVHRLIETLGGGPVDYFGSSGGATVGLALIQAHPNDIRTFVGHEPPVIELLPDRDEQRQAIQDIYDTYKRAGSQAAMMQFMQHIGVMGAGDEAPAWEPTPEQMERMDETNKVFYEHLIRQTTAFKPDLDALRAAPTRIVIGIGETSKGQLAHRTGVAVAEALGLEPVEFPGDHGGFMSHSEPFSRVLKAELTGSNS
jgi:pimeloyl-ACP methyl ester carboxylesterase